jgi:hypothetical protein
MAEIHVERKRGVGAWVWVLLLVILVVAAVLYFWQTGYINLSSNSVFVQQMAFLNVGGSYGA